MAKKPAPKKKVSASKSASNTNAKKSAGKSVVKPAAKKAAKPVAKRVSKPAQVGNKGSAKSAKLTSPAASKKIETVKPSLMTKKGKKVEVDEVEEAQPVVKSQTVVSMIESESGSQEPSKAEKVSKVKPVKIERGNLSDEKAKWAELFKKYGKDKAITYKMSEKFTNMTPLQHKILGWGFILTNENDRLEVLFESGIRMLISNYKS